MKALAAEAYGLQPKPAGAMTAAVAGDPVDGKVGQGAVHRGVSAVRHSLPPEGALPKNPAQFRLTAFDEELVLGRCRVDLPHCSLWIRFARAPSSIQADRHAIVALVASPPWSRLRRPLECPRGDDVRPVVLGTARPNGRS